MQEVKKVKNKELSELEKRLQNKRNQKSSQKRLFLISLIAIFIGLVFWFQSSIVSNFFTFYNNNNSNGISYSKQEAKKIYIQNVANNENTVKIWGSIFILFSTVGFAHLYMSGFFKRREEKNLNEETEDDLTIISLLKSIDKSIEKGKLESVLSENEKKEIIDKIVTTIDSQLNESLLSQH